MGVLGAGPKGSYVCSRMGSVTGGGCTLFGRLAEPYEQRAYEQRNRSENERRGHEETGAYEERSNIPVNVPR